MRVIKAYFDNSGKPQDSKLAWVTVAGVVAPEESWQIFDARWAEAMGDRRFLHMKELTKPKQESDSPYYGMSESDKNLLLSRAVGVLLSMEQPSFRFFGVACTADKIAYERAKLAGLQPPSLPERCGEVCFWHIVERFGVAEDVSIHVFYDNGEQQFFKRILKDWENRKKRIGDTVLSRIPFKPTPVVDMRKSPGMQAADFIAWHVYRSYASDFPEVSWFATHAVLTKHVELDEDYWFGRPHRGPDDSFIRRPKRPEVR